MPNLPQMPNWSDLPMPQVPKISDITSKLPTMPTWSDISRLSTFLPDMHLPTFHIPDIKNVMYGMPFDPTKLVSTLVPRIPTGVQIQCSAGLKTPSIIPVPSGLTNIQSGRQFNLSQIPGISYYLPFNLVGIDCWTSVQITIGAPSQTETTTSQISTPEVPQTAETTAASR